MKIFLYLIILILFLSLLTVSLFFLFSKEEIKNTELILKAEEVELEEPIEKIIPEQAEVPILIYHHIRNFSDKDSENDRTFVVPADDFEEQLKYLQDNNFAAISFENLVDYFSGDFAMPAKPVIISFDDGLMNQYENALPLLKQYGFSATFFIFTNPVSKSKNYMTWENLGELIELGMEIGVHGHYHLYFDRISKKELDKELAGSKELIKKNIDYDARVVAYPFGTYNDEVIELIKQTNYSAARGIVNGVVHTKEDLYELDGYFVTDSFARFKYIVNQ